MAKSASAGEMRTRIQVFDMPEDRRVDGDGFQIKALVNVFGEASVRYCRWVNAYGTEVYTARQAGIMEPATLTMRFTPKVTPTCLILKGIDKRPYEVISVNDVEDRHEWLEVKVKRKAAAK